MPNTFRKIFSLAMLTASVTVATQAQTIKTTISFPNATLSIAADPVSNKIYVVNPTISGTNDDIAVIDGSADVLLQNIPVTIGASFVAVDFFANRIYVAGCDYTQNPSPCIVSVIDGSTNKVVRTIPITSTPGLGLTGITVNPLDRKVYVANGSDNVINIIDGCNNKLVGTIGLNGNTPFAININPINGRLYVPYGTNLTAVIDAHRKKIVSTTTFGNSTVGVASNFFTGHVFITDQESGPAMTGITNSRGKLLASVTVDDSPQGVDVDPVTNLAFVAASSTDTVDVIDGSTNTLKAAVTSVPADYVAVNLATQKVYVSGRTGVTVLTEQ